MTVTKAGAGACASTASSTTLSERRQKAEENYLARLRKAGSKTPKEPAKEPAKEPRSRSTTKRVIEAKKPAPSKPSRPEFVDQTPSPAKAKNKPAAASPAKKFSPAKAKQKSASASPAAEKEFLETSSVLPEEAVEPEKDVEPETPALAKEEAIIDRQEEAIEAVQEEELFGLEEDTVMIAPLPRKASASLGDDDLQKSSALQSQLVQVVQQAKACLAFEQKAGDGDEFPTGFLEEMIRRGNNRMLDSPESEDSADCRQAPVTGGLKPGPLFTGEPVLEEPCQDDSVKPHDDQVLEEPCQNDSIKPHEDEVLEEPCQHDSVKPHEDQVLEEPCQDDSVKPHDDEVLEEPCQHDSVKPHDDEVLEEPCQDDSVKPHEDEVLEEPCQHDSVKPHEDEVLEEPCQHDSVKPHDDEVLEEPCQDDSFKPHDDEVLEEPCQDDSFKPHEDQVLEEQCQDDSIKPHEVEVLEEPRQDDYDSVKPHEEKDMSVTGHDRVLDTLEAEQEDDLALFRQVPTTDVQELQPGPLFTESEQALCGDAVLGLISLEQEEPRPADFDALLPARVEQVSEESSQDDSFQGHGDEETVDLASLQARLCRNSTARPLVLGAISEDEGTDTSSLAVKPAEEKCAEAGPRSSIVSLDSELSAIPQEETTMSFLKFQQLDSLGPLQEIDDPSRAEDEAPEKLLDTSEEWLHEQEVPDALDKQLEASDQMASPDTLEAEDAEPEALAQTPVQDVQDALDKQIEVKNMRVRHIFASPDTLEAEDAEPEALAQTPVQDVQDALDKQIEEDSSSHGMTPGPHEVISPAPLRVPETTPSKCSDFLNEAGKDEMLREVAKQLQAVSVSVGKGSHLAEKPQWMSLADASRAGIPVDRAAGSRRRAPTKEREQRDERVRAQSRGILTRIRLKTATLVSKKQCLSLALLGAGCMCVAAVELAWRLGPEPEWFA